jgi:Na+/pantothenate symporter
MNQLMIIVVALVVFVYFGGKYVPKVLKDNKKIILGLVGGLVLCSFMYKNVEGLCNSGECCNELEEDPETQDTMGGIYTYGGMFDDTITLER